MLWRCMHVVWSEFLFQQMGFPSRMQQPGVGQPSGQNQFLQQTQFPAASPGMNTASMPMTQPGNQTPVSQVSFWFLEVISVGSVIYWFHCSISSNRGALVFSRCFWNYVQLNSFIEILHFSDIALGMAWVKRWLVLRLKFKCDGNCFKFRFMEQRRNCYSACSS